MALRRLSAASWSRRAVLRASFACSLSSSARYSIASARYFAARFSRFTTAPCVIDAEKGRPCVIDLPISWVLLVYCFRVSNSALSWLWPEVKRVLFNGFKGCWLTRSGPTQWRGVGPEQVFYLSNQ